jgi:glucuronosyltransferase
VTGVQTCALPIYKGAPHIRSAVLDLTWYQYFLLDVIAVLALAVGSILFFVLLALRVVLRKVFSGKTREKSSTSRKKQN